MVHLDCSFLKTSISGPVVIVSIPGMGPDKLKSVLNMYEQESLLELHAVGIGVEELDHIEPQYTAFTSQIEGIIINQDNRYRYVYLISKETVSETFH